MTSERWIETGGTGALAALLLATACGGSGGPREDGRPRNAILISIDTLRPDHLGCYGHPRDTSPTLDGLAAAGVRFADVTSASPWTLPSHATMLTGLYPNHHGVKTHEQRLSDQVVTVAEEFRDAGYATFAVVNTHNVGAEQFQLDQGFEKDHFSYIQETEDDVVNFTLRTHNNGEQIVATAKEFLRSREDEEPFFLFLHFYDVHTDFTPKDEYREQFVRPYSGRMTGSTMQLVKVRNAEEQLGDADVAWLREMYEAEIRQLDDVLGRFLGWLDDEGMLDETLLVITSDHGEEFQEHGSVLHGRTYYEEVARIPLLVQGPSVPAGRVVETPVHGIDVTPTILGIMGIPSRQERDGIDLSAEWKGGGLPERTFFAEADHNNRVEGEIVSDIKKMVRQGTTKLHLDTHTGAVELYDIASDALERTDLAPGSPERVAELRAALERFLESAVVPEAVPPPTEEERKKLEALGYF